MPDRSEGRRKKTKGWADLAAEAMQGMSSSDDDGSPSSDVQEEVGEESSDSSRDHGSFDDPAPATPLVVAGDETPGGSDDGAATPVPDRAEDSPEPMTPPHAAPPEGPPDAPPPPPGAAHEAEASEGGEREVAEVSVDIPGYGRIAYYSKRGGFYEATCGAHRCRLTKKAHAGARKAQGRPLGLIGHWLFVQHDEINCTAVAHMHPVVGSDKMERYLGRHWLSTIAGTAALFTKERPKADDEVDSEPDRRP